jgi:hypothetical protein
MKLWKMPLLESVTAAQPNQAASARRVTRQVRSHESALPADAIRMRKTTTPW